jgi:hypothetical protein
VTRNSSNGGGISGELDDRLDAWLEDFVAMLGADTPAATAHPTTKGLPAVQRLLFAELLAEALADALAPRLAAELAPRLLQLLEQQGGSPEPSDENRERRPKDPRHESSTKSHTSGTTGSSHA